MSLPQIEAKTIPAPPNTTVNIYGFKLPVIAYAATAQGETIPVIDTMSDFKWQYDCLMSRLKNPDIYAHDEDVQIDIEQLKCWLREHIEESRELPADKQIHLFEILYA